jgi:hypothetical protein
MFPPDAMDNYGVDKPDLRFENRICDVSSSFRSVSLPFLQEFSGKLLLDLPNAVSYGNIQGLLLKLVAPLPVFFISVAVRTRGIRMDYWFQECI